MKEKKKILFIQHASGFGGSAMSLLYTLQGIKIYSHEQYEMAVALAKWTKPLSDFYEHAGFEVIKPDRIDTYEHTQLVEYKLWNPIHLVKEIIQQIRIRKARLNTEKLIDRVKPDIIHLNSVVLVGSALAAKKKKIPLVWHVREPSVKGLFGLRRAILKKYLITLPDKVVFICNADRESWGNPANGLVVYNFVDFGKFGFNMERPDEICGINIPKGDLNILFLGAVSRVKGGIYLIKAVNKLLAKYPHKKIYLLFPGGVYNSPHYFIYVIAKVILPLFGQGTYSQKIEKEISNSPHPDSFLKFRFVTNVAQLIAASDVVVFPSIRPHFARPIIEAGAMGKPVIGSHLGGVEELILHNKTGFYVKPKSVSDLAEKLDYFLNNKDELSKMGMNGYQIAIQKFQAKENVISILNIYRNLIIQTETRNVF